MDKLAEIKRCHALTPGRLFDVDERWLIGEVEGQRADNFKLEGELDALRVLFPAQPSSPVGESWGGEGTGMGGDGGFDEEGANGDAGDDCEA